jgi:hypothetical protein
MLATSVKIIERTEPYTSCSQGMQYVIGLKLHARSHHGARFENRIMPLFELPPIGLSTCHARRRLAAADAVEHHYFQEASPSPGPCYSPSSCRKSLKKKVMLKKKTFHISPGTSQ